MALPATHEELFFNYATGRLAEAPALLVATHLALKPAARAEVVVFETLGGSLLEEVAPAALSSDLLTRTLARLEEPRAAPAAKEASGALPAPLRALAPQGLEKLAWRRVKRGLRDCRLPLAGGTLRLMELAAGTRVPRHSHRGLELTLVLQGAYHDGLARYERGDLQIADSKIDHRPAAEPGSPCLCLVVTDQPVRFTGPVGKLLNPFFRY